MGLIYDSDVYLNKDRLLAQHQAALSLLQGRLDKPGLTDLIWLDLGCGKGQIIVNLEHNIGDEARTKISYFAFDIIEEHISVTLKKAESLKFKSSDGKIGDISDFPNLFPVDQKYDFITLTNSIHEFSPLLIPDILFESILRLSQTGLLFVYDMESLPSLELGAITWTREDIHELLKSFFKHFNIAGYNPTPGRWHHSTCIGWNIQINREYINLTNEELISRKIEAIALIKTDTISILKRKLDDCRKILESITKHGAATDEEEKSKQKLLYDFWSLNRIKEIQE
jgi:SAM-dependent methyltransferase